MKEEEETKGKKSEKAVTKMSYPIYPTTGL